MMEYRAAMTAASVGVKAPEKMPPMMSIGDEVIAFLLHF